MKTWILFLLMLLCSITLVSQYQVGGGFYFNTISQIKSEEFLLNGTNSVDLSLKFTTEDYQCYDIFVGKRSDNFHFSVLKEVHRQLFYPVDFYLGLGMYICKWDRSFLDSNPINSIAAGIDGSLGIQLYFKPIAFSIGFRPVWTFLWTDQFFWDKQIGIRICY
ncbi:MAG: hypothetical protein JXR36_00810 [Bacteroidales bacterium]|nr:hypothetical protein [Bacteroidales bacterium]